MKRPFETISADGKRVLVGLSGYEGARTVGVQITSIGTEAWVQLSPKQVKQLITQLSAMHSMLTH